MTHDKAPATPVPSRGGLSPAAMGAFMHWWARLSDAAASGTDKADRAVLRRCDTPTAVACTGAYQRVYRRMAQAHEGAPWTSWQQDRLAALVGLAAHVRTSSERSLPVEMGQRSAAGDSPCVSELRFRRLVESPDIDSLFTGVRRVLPLIKHQVDLKTLAVDLWQWNEAVKKRWVYAYYDPATSRNTEQANR